MRARAEMRKELSIAIKQPEPWHGKFDRAMGCSRALISIGRIAAAVAGDSDFVRQGEGRGHGKTCCQGEHVEPQVRHCCRQTVLLATGAPQSIP